MTDSLKDRFNRNIVTLIQFHQSNDPISLAFRTMKTIDMNKVYSRCRYMPWIKFTHGFTKKLQVDCCYRFWDTDTAWKCEIKWIFSSSQLHFIPPLAIASTKNWLKRKIVLNARAFFYNLVLSILSLVWHVATQAVSKRKESSDDQLGRFSFSSANCLYLD